MKKTFKFIFLSLFVIVSMNRLLFAQTDTMATIFLRDVSLVRPNIMEFELRLLRNSDKWEYWANGSFEFAFDSAGFNFSPQNTTLEYQSNTSDLDLRPIAGQIPHDNYLLTARVFPNRFSITIIGPENYTNAVKVGFDTLGVRIGKFRIIGPDSVLLPTKIKWLQPAFYYQACAFKLTNDSIILPSVIINYVDDNIEMNNSMVQIVNYRTEQAPEIGTEIIDFIATYMGSKKVRLSWTSKSELYVKGWIIARALRDYDKQEKVENLNYADTVADFRKVVPPHDILAGLGTRIPGRYYEFDFDTVPYRGVDYCYELMYMDFNGVLHPKLAYDCVSIPNSVITFAQNNPNPFPGSTVISYTVDDDVYLTCKVYDLQGKLVETMFEDRFTKMGHYTGSTGIIFNAPELAQQGLYNIVLLAYPINDKSVDISKAIIKAQLIR